MRYLPAMHPARALLSGRDSDDCNEAEVREPADRWRQVLLRAPPCRKASTRTAKGGKTRQAPRGDPRKDRPPAPQRTGQHSSQGAERAREGGREGRKEGTTLLTESQLYKAFSTIHQDTQVSLPITILSESLQI